MKLRSWSDSIDPSTIPDDVLHGEAARRRSAKRQTYGAGTGRPKTLRPCPNCTKPFGAAELRRHLPQCQPPVQRSSGAAPETS